MTRILTGHRSVTDLEEAEIQRQIAADPDDNEATDQDLAKAIPFAEAFPDLMESIKRARGRPVAASVKTPVTIRLDPEILAYYKATGKGWQSRINDALKLAAGLKR